VECTIEESDFGSDAGALMRKIFSIRRWSTAAALGVLTTATVSGCLSSTAAQPSLLNLNGTWRYTGSQTGSAPETLTGTLTISRESGTSFQGTLHVDAVSQSGQTRGLDGLVSGSERGNVIDFDADLETDPRRHVGQIVADTITGSWVGTSPTGAATTGTFRVERESQ
jgi:hypothetical protein